MKNDRFNIAIKAKSLIELIDNIIINYPRKEYVLKDRIQNTSFDVLELIYLANVTTDRKCLQMKILSKISMLDYYLEVSYKKKCISEKKLSMCTNLLESIVKMIYGWVKTDES